MIARQPDDPPYVVAGSGRRLPLNDHVTPVDLAGMRGEQKVPRPEGVRHAR